MMDKMMAKFFEGMTREDKQKMMQEMMPHCLGMMLPRMPEENRIEFFQKLVKSLLDNGTSDMPAEEKKACTQGVIEAIQIATTPAWSWLLTILKQRTFFHLSCKYAGQLTFLSWHYGPETP
jgi:hypothetical protein